MALESINMHDGSIALGIFRDLSFIFHEIQLDNDCDEINKENATKVNAIIYCALTKSISALVKLIETYGESIRADILVKFYDFLLVRILNLSKIALLFYTYLRVLFLLHEKDQHKQLFD
jgi:hypothetical protein